MKAEQDFKLVCTGGPYGDCCCSYAVELRGEWTVQFVGQTSCGFVREKYYEIEISAGRSGCLCVRDVQGQGFCPYSTLAALRKNWKIINNEKTPGGEPGRNEAGYERGYFDPR